MKTINPIKIHLILCNLVLLCTGAFAQTETTVGPRPPALSHRDYVGHLIVFSATEAYADGKDAYYYPHTSYDVFQNGLLVRHVDNGRTLQVETPTRVTLPKGDYDVVAESEKDGTVKLHVKIETGRATVLHLEGDRNWKPDVAAVDQDKLVRLPNGQPVGYQAR